MADTFSKSERSNIMRLVKSSRNKSTELRLLKYFKERGVKGWRRNYDLPGKPDITFPKIKAVIFLDGCFWHGHDCRNTKPANNEDYWNKKIERNKERDKEITRLLKHKGWKVFRIWECELKNTTSLNRLNNKLIKRN